MVSGNRNQGSGFIGFRAAGVKALHAVGFTGFRGLRVWGFRV